MNVITGNAETATASRTRQWVVGHFMENGAAQTGAVEIRLWRYDDPIDYGLKLFAGTEFVVIDAGVIEIDLEPALETVGTKQTVRLEGRNRDYVVIPPGYMKRVRFIELPAYGVTARWPSFDGVTKVLE